MRARHKGRDAAKPSRPGWSWDVARALLVLQGLAMPVPTARSGPQARAHDRADGLAAGSVSAMAHASAAGTDPLGRVQISEHGPRLVAPSLLVREQVNGHKGDLLRSVRPRGAALDYRRRKDHLRFTQGGRRITRPVRGSEVLTRKAGARR